MAGQNELQAEFSQLIATIGKEVVRDVTYATALKEMKSMNEGLSDFRSALPRQTKEMQQLSTYFASARNDVQSMLSKSATQMGEHERALKKSLQDITNQYNLLSSSLLESHSKAMRTQTAAIRANTDETIEQVHCAIVEMRKDLTQQCRQIQGLLESADARAKSDIVTMGYKIDMIEYNLAQAMLQHAAEIQHKAERKNNRLMLMMAGNMGLLIALLTLALTIYWR